MTQLTDLQRAMIVTRVFALGNKEDGNLNEKELREIYLEQLYWCGVLFPNGHLAAEGMEGSTRREVEPL